MERLNHLPKVTQLIGMMDLEHLAPESVLWDGVCHRGSFVLENLINNPSHLHIRGHIIYIYLLNHKLDCQWLNFPDP